MSGTVYEAVTAQIIDALGRGVVPWRKPWAESAPPMNAVSKRPYRGVNVFLLGFGLYRDHRWLTFRQAKQLGGYVRNGEKSYLAVFWKQLDSEKVDPSTGEVRGNSIPFLRYYHVFNVEQCQGLNLPPLPSPTLASPTLRIERAESLASGMPDPPTIKEGGTAAFYNPADDRIQIPRLSSFNSTDAFYATLFHELGHATGHEKRLNRPGVTEAVGFGSGTYSREELVAELTSAYCCSSLGLDTSLIENSAAYIDGWLKSLKRDPKAIVVAASQAQRAADYISGKAQDDP